MNISQAAKISGLSAKTIRYYESIGLIAAPHREDNGYRCYQQKDLDVLRFIQRARATGFSVDECRQLVSLYQNPSRQSSEVKELVQEKLQRVAAQIADLQHLRMTLEQLVSHCAGNEAAQCGIIDTLAEQESDP
jgi:MerR family copper efflux transcriptional regulator